MATTWLTYATFNADHAGAATEAEFTDLSARAARVIEDVTDWKASLATDDSAIAALAACQEQLVLSLIGQDKAEAAAGSGAVTSASNDGYSESYTSAAAMRAENDTRNTRLVRQMLGAPDIRWMLYAGGVYHPAGRR